MTSEDVRWILILLPLAALVLLIGGADRWGET